MALIVVVSTAFSNYLSPALTGFSTKLEPIGERLAEMLISAMPRYSGTHGPRILREVWPLQLTVRESDLPRKAVHEHGKAFDASPNIVRLPRKAP